MEENMIYENLTIRNSFMFGKVTQDPKIARRMADVLVPGEMGSIKEAGRERILQGRKSSKYVRLDPFDRGLYKYSFHHVCDELPDLRLEDETNIIFYNTKADLTNAPAGIKRFLEYVETGKAEDEFTQMLEESVQEARENEEWRSEFLKTFVNDMDMRREGIAIGEKRERVKTERERQRADQEAERAKQATEHAHQLQRELDELKKKIRGGSSVTERSLS